MRSSTLLLALLLAVFAASCTLSPDAVIDAAPGKSKAVVFDIDGTLTPDVHTLNTARNGAADAVNTFAAAGITIVYLTARVPLFQSGIPAWLEKNGFPEGRIHVTETREDRKDHAAFKLRVLEDYRSRGWTFTAAFGDSSSDFQAYAGAGIPGGRIFALRRKGDENCQPGPWSGCYVSWAELQDAIQLAIEGPRDTDLEAGPGISG
jgi:phosphatidate phosphatase PAH1